jgi:hypothetical protein
MLLLVFFLVLQNRTIGLSEEILARTVEMGKQK